MGETLWKGWAPCHLVSEISSWDVSLQMGGGGEGFCLFSICGQGMDRNAQIKRCEFLWKGVDQWKSRKYAIERGGDFQIELAFVVNKWELSRKILWWGRLEPMNLYWMSWSRAKTWGKSQESNLDQVNSVKSALKYSTKGKRVIFIKSWAVRIGWEKLVIS